MANGQERARAHILSRIKAFDMKSVKLMRKKEGLRRRFDIFIQHTHSARDDDDDDEKKK